MQYKTSKTGKSGEVSNWTTYPKNGITLTRNQDINVRIVDSTGQTSGTYATGSITIIDKLPPNSFTPNVITASYNMIVIVGTVTDQTATDDYSNSGIAGYAFSKDNGSTWTSYQTSSAYQFHNLTDNTTYTMKMKAKDNAGNERISNSISYTTPKQTYTIKYDANGGTGAPSSQTKTKGTNLTLRSTKPTRTGYTFQGWTRTKGSSKVEYKAGATYSTDKEVTLYAVWTKIIEFSNGTTLSKFFDDDVSSISLSTKATIPAGVTIHMRMGIDLEKEFGGSLSYRVNGVQKKSYSKAANETRIHLDGQIWDYTTESEGSYTFSFYIYKAYGTGNDTGAALVIDSITDANNNVYEFK